MPDNLQNHCHCFHLKLGNFSGDLSPRILKSLVFPVPKFSPKNLKTPSPSPLCPQILGTGKRIFEFRCHIWTPYWLPYPLQIATKLEALRLLGILNFTFVVSLHVRKITQRALVYSVVPRNYPKYILWI